LIFWLSINFESILNIKSHPKYSINRFMAKAINIRVVYVSAFVIWNFCNKVALSGANFAEIESIKKILKYSNIFR
jgi:hypothetical protein